MQKIEISARTVIFVVAVVLLLQFLFLIRDLIFTLFIAFIISSALYPLVERLMRLRVARAVAAPIVFFLFLGFFVALVTLIFPPLIKESALLFNNLPGIMVKAVPNISDLINLSSLSQYLPNLTNQAFTIIQGAFSNVFFVVTTMFFSFYFLVEDRPIKNVFGKFLSEVELARMMDVVVKVRRRLNAWFWGELALMTVVGLLTFIGLSVLGVRYAVPLAVLAGLLEVVPNLGPVLAAVPAALIGFSQNYVTGVAVLVLALVVQQLENNLIVPLVMKIGHIGLRPMVSNCKPFGKRRMFSLLNYRICKSRLFLGKSTISRIIQS